MFVAQQQLVVTANEPERGAYAGREGGTKTAECAFKGHDDWTPGENVEPVGDVDSVNIALRIYEVLCTKRCVKLHGIRLSKSPDDVFTPNCEIIVGAPLSFHEQRPIGIEFETVGRLKPQIETCAPDSVEDITRLAAELQCPIALGDDRGRRG